MAALREPHLLRDPVGAPGFMTGFRRAGINPDVDDGFVSSLKSGRSRIVGEIERVDHDGVILTTGAHLHADTVICATGYRRGLQNLVGHLGVLDDRGGPRYCDGAPCNSETPGLYFAGFRMALSGSMRVAGTHARRIGKAITTDT